MQEIKIFGTDKYIQVDDEDYIRTKMHSWGLIGHSDGSGISAWTFLKKQSIGSFILNCNGLVDHIDRNIYNNQKSNLRKCSIYQNAHNRSKRKNSISSYKGVTLHKANYPKQWSARIGIKGRRLDLGHFYTELDAAKAYNEAAIKYHKEFAVLNNLGMVQ